MSERDYSTISPSAKSLLLMKGYTNIPFAQQAAELAMQPEKYIRDYTRKDFTFWARTYHFESRYRSINQLAFELPVKNILELSSGFSFRGLDAVTHEGIYYIDTDLPEMIAVKNQYINALKEGVDIKGKLEVLPLNALDEAHFREIVSHFPPGEISIVNEGLLMYLDMAEKEKLCKIIHAILKERGGYWITADIYVKNNFARRNMNPDDKLQQFLEKHRVRENSFGSFKEAAEFFKRVGFTVEKEARIDRSKLTSLPYLLKSVSKWKLIAMRFFGGRVKIQATWRLRAV